MVFALLLGIGLGSVDTPGTDEALRVLNALFSAFSRIFEWIMMPLALGLFCVMAGVAANSNSELFFALTGYVGAFMVACGAVIAVYTIFLIVTRRFRHARDFTNLRRPLVIAFLTNSPIIALRSTISTLVEHFGTTPDITKTWWFLRRRCSATRTDHQHRDAWGLPRRYLQYRTWHRRVHDFGNRRDDRGNGLGLAAGEPSHQRSAQFSGPFGVPNDLATVVLVTTGQIIGPLVSLITIYTTVTLLLLGRRSTNAARAGTDDPKPEPMT